MTNIITEPQKNCVVFLATPVIEVTNVVYANETQSGSRGRAGQRKKCRTYVIEMRLSEHM